MKIGITTTLPVEIVYASGNTPIDLNNILVTGNAEKSINLAERRGFPRNICAWIKGLYTTAKETGIDELIGVVEGDCSNTHSLMSLLKSEGIKVSSFSFPYNRNRNDLSREIKRFAQHYDTDWNDVIKVKHRLDMIRGKLLILDQLTYRDNKVTGFENHLWLVSSSDFNSDYEKFDQELTSFIEQVKKRKAYQNEIRLAFLGVPPIITDVYQVFEELGARVVYNEVQRQFAMPYLKSDIVDQYLSYTYPYDVEFRLLDIRTELKKREIDAVISYTQSFCHRQIDNILLKKNIDLPILFLEGDRPGKLDERSKLRIESFLEMLDK